MPMPTHDDLLSALTLSGASAAAIRRFAEAAGVPPEALRFYNEHHQLPSREHLSLLARHAGMSEDELMLRLGIVDRRLMGLLQQHAQEIAQLLPAASNDQASLGEAPSAIFQSEFGTLYQGDCLLVMPHLDSESIDVVFADPPFNLDKLYPSGIDDDLRARTYLEWCEQWISECIRVLKPGGSLFVWNLPRWNSALSQFLSERLTFRHWIAADIKYSLPITGKLYPSHYSLLFFCKGERPRVFHPDRLPMEICPSCFADLRDYGGYKAKMNPLGVNLTDVWFDIYPVRHTKFKKRDGANELPIKLLDRVLEMSSDEGDVVLDPFGGAGTTYAVAEIKRRRWIGMEIGPVEDIIERIGDLRAEAQRLKAIREGYNRLFTRESELERDRRGLWTDRTIRLVQGDGEHGMSEEHQAELPLDVR
jgi:site-specific DNA-methyltransferase (adenine-specific)